MVIAFWNANGLTTRKMESEELIHRHHLDAMLIGETQFVALESSELKPKAWFRYVDDTFIIKPHDRGTLDSFLGHLSSQHPDIKSTMEEEKNGVIPFLDVLVRGNRKFTHTDRKKT
ncbi:hypothetical protein Trydic_g22031 [Trypoxylus dichotomus]